MIRKPDAREFRESSTVAALRDAGALAVEGARGVKEGTFSFIGTAFTLVMGFGFLMSVAIHIAALGPMLFGGGGVTTVLWFLQRRTRRNRLDRAARWREPDAPAARAAPITEPVRVDLSVGAVGRTAAKLAVPAILFFPTRAQFGFMAPFALAAIAVLALAVLTLVRLAGDRMVLRYDAQTLTVQGLLGLETIMWADVGDIVVRKAAPWSLRTLFTSGARRNIVVLGRHNRLGGPDTLYVPVNILGLDAPGLGRLLTDLLAMRGAAAAPGLTDVVPASPPSRHVGLTASGPDHSFDPDAIMARYLAEREALIASRRPGSPPGRAPSFGRKLV